MTLLLAGDVMIGRGLDQIQRHPSDPTLHESSVRDARVYVDLAEAVNGPIPRNVNQAYIWGNVFDRLDRFAPDFRVINLETSVTSSEECWAGKGVHYRMHPDNLDCLTTGAIDCCVLANNHVLDWGYAGLGDTIGSLYGAGIAPVVAGPTIVQASRPSVHDLDGLGRVLVFAVGSPSAGVPHSWSAGADRPGVWVVDERQAGAVAQVAQSVREYRQDGDYVVLSIHWGPNWGFEIEPSQRSFARRLIEQADVDLVFGHSSHHVKGLELYRGKLILYGCGDLLNDYEGIRGHEDFRDDLGLLYLVSIEPPSSRVTRLRMIPTRVQRMQLTNAPLESHRLLVRSTQTCVETLDVHLGNEGVLEVVIN